ncbi:hypothetical protein [Limibacillus sp. MBR-115]|uniref:hypothetical protein n=1 Tax=Limibacillus sp. MBR-115 TaxID=3156465 RepID=UPI0033942254
MRAADFNWKTGAAQGECRLFALTEFPNDLNHSEATKDFMKLDPPPEKKKQRAQNLRPAVSKSAPHLPKNNQKPVKAVSNPAPANGKFEGPAVSKSAGLIKYQATGESGEAISATTTDGKLVSRLVSAGLAAEQAWNALLVLDQKKLAEIQGAEADGSLTTQTLLDAVQKCAVSGGQ